VKDGAPELLWLVEGGRVGRYTVRTAMPTGLKRYQQTQHFHFITFSCYRRQAFLESSAAKDNAQQIFEQVRRQQSLCVAGYVLMPEHIHLLTDEPATGTLAGFLQIFKQLTSRQLKAAEQKQFWQRRYYDFNVHSEEKRIEKLRYIHRNPVKRGLVARPEDYRWSSFNHYATGEPHLVEIESEWTARFRERRP
jgi:putative transposase